MTRPDGSGHEFTLRRRGRGRVSLGRACGAHACFSAATANVNTLHPGEDCSRAADTSFELLLGKVQFLEKQFDEQGLMVVGVQEGRSRAQTTRKGSLSSGVPT